MGKTKTKIIDDSLPEEVKKVEKKKPVEKPGEDLIAKINAELGVSEPAEKKAQKEVFKEKLQKTVSEKPKRQTANAPKKKPRSKKYQEVTSEIDRTKFYPVNEAIELAKNSSYTKFMGTLEVHLNTDKTGIRGLVSLPFAAGKKLRIVAFGKGAEESGADIVGDESLIESINKGKVNFDLVITTPEWMSKLAKVAKNLGPRGLMPNPKNGTITEDLKKAVESFQAGKTEYKTEGKAAVMHLSIGKTNQETAEILANIKSLLQTVGKTRIKKLTLSPTMGAGVKVDLTSI